MNSGYYAAFTGLLARTQALDTAASNLANTSTAGFKAERDFFRSTLLGPTALNSQLGRTVNNFGLLGGDQLDMAQGSLVQTGNMLDVAISGQGFFAVQAANGTRYTRDGNLHRAPNGILVTADGDAVLDTLGRPIPLPPGQVSIGANGVISVGGGILATIGVFSFPADTQLVPEGVNRFKAPAQAKATLVRDAIMHQGAIEGANQDVVQGSMELIMVQRQAEMMQKALTIFHTDFNKFASEDLPKI